MENEKQPHAMHISRRCGAKGKRTGEPCRAPAMANGRCRMHGGKSTGAPRGNKNALKTGCYTRAAREQRKSFRKLMTALKQGIRGEALLKETNAATLALNEFMKEYGIDEDYFNQL